MFAPHQIHAHIEIKPRDCFGVNFPDRYLKVTFDGVVRQGQRSLISVSDAGHSSFALLKAVDAIAIKFGMDMLGEQGITVSDAFFKRRKDETGWHRDEVLTALQALDRRLDDAARSKTP